MAKGYQSYRGRSSVGRKLLVALLVLILAAACGFMFLQRYITYRDDGGMSIVLPFWQLDLPAPPQAAASPPEDTGPSAEDQLPAVDLTIEPAEPEPEPEPEPVDLFGEHRLVELASLPADRAALTQLLAERGANGFLYTVRDSSGQVFFSSPVVQAQAMRGDEAANETMRVLCETEDVVAVARFNACCISFRLPAALYSAIKISLFLKYSSFP